jgi:hypothetical protein
MCTSLSAGRRIRGGMKVCLPPLSPALLTISPLTITYVCVVPFLPVRDGFHPKTESSPPETSYTTHILIRTSDVYFDTQSSKKTCVPFPLHIIPLTHSLRSSFLLFYYCFTKLAIDRDHPDQHTTMAGPRKTASEDGDGAPDPGYGGGSSGGRKAS